MAELFEDIDKWKLISWALEYDKWYEMISKVQRHIYTVQANYFLLNFQINLLLSLQKNRAILVFLSWSF